jgi:hypothetical protein
VLGVLRLRLEPTIDRGSGWVSEHVLVSTGGPGGTKSNRSPTRKPLLEQLPESPRWAAAAAVRRPLRPFWRPFD